MNSYLRSYWQKVTELMINVVLVSQKMVVAKDRNHKKTSSLLLVATIREKVAFTF